MTDEIVNTCCVCGAEIPRLPKEQLIELGAAIRRSEDQIVYVCLNRHTKEEIINAVTGVPVFRRASELKRGII